QARGDELLKGAFFRQLCLTLQAPGDPARLRLGEAALLAENQGWATVFRVMDPSERTTNPTARVTHIAELCRKTDIGQPSLVKSTVDVDSRSAEVGDCRIDLNWAEPRTSNSPAEFKWLLQRIARYFHDAFFFDPFRHSRDHGPAQYLDALDKD